MTDVSPTVSVWESRIEVSRHEAPYNAETLNRRLVEAGFPSSLWAAYSLDSCGETVSSIHKISGFIGGFEATEHAREVLRIVGEVAPQATVISRWRKTPPGELVPRGRWDAVFHNSAGT